MPNSTDVTEFRRIPGVAYFNVAMVGGWQRYHSPLDTPQNLNPRSVQQMGAYALGAARRFGSLALPGAGYLFAWLALFGQGALWSSLHRSGEETVGTLTRQTLWALPAALLGVPWYSPCSTASLTCPPCPRC